jgi:hypothetical protein
MRHLTGRKLKKRTDEKKILKNNVPHPIVNVLHLSPVSFSSMGM